MRFCPGEKCIHYSKATKYPRKCYYEPQCWKGYLDAIIVAAVASDIINVAAGTYTEDLSIPEGKNNLELVGATGATIKGVVQSDDELFPYADPNIDILSSGVKIHGFTIAGPDPVVDKYASGVLIGASSVEIYENDFEVTAGKDTYVGPISQTIQSYRKTCEGFEDIDLSGLNIHDNTFTHLTTDAGLAGYEGIFINLDTGTGTATISDNEFTGNVMRAIGTERSNTVISDNTIVTDLAPYASVGGFQGMYIGCYPVGEDFGPVQTDVSITDNTVKGSDAAKGFAQGIRVGHTTQLGLEDITISNNTVQYNTEGITVRADASGVTVSYNDIIDNSVGVQNDDTGVELDAENNWWGTVNGPDHADNTFNVGSQGDASSDDVDYVPWLDAAYATGVSFAPVTSEDGDFSSIQAAIDAATSTTITCAAGTYTENLYIDKSLTVQSEEGAITDEVEWDIVTELYGDVGIELGWDGEDPLAETVVFDGFYIEEQEVPIYLYDVDNGSDLTISNNVLNWFIVGIMSDGFTVDNASSVTIEGNYIFYGDWCGIYFEMVVGGSELTIRDNLVFWNDEGIYIDYLAEESTATIEDNIVAENDCGIDLYDVDESTVTITGNTIGAGYSECMDMMLAPNYYVGIYFSGEDTVSGSTVTIGGDTRAEGNVMIGNGWDGDGMCGGIIVYSDLVASSLEILNNDILDSYDYGVWISWFDEYSSVDIHYNSIAGNSSGVSYDSPYIIDATCNWWGDIAGPSIYTNPYESNGDTVTSDAAYIPWLIQSDLAADWNIWSPPIAPDEDSWLQMQAELVEDGIVDIYYFDSAAQLWGTDPDDAGPLDALYIKMPAESRIRYCISDEATYPGQKDMAMGWNLIGVTELYEMYPEDVLFDAYWATGQPDRIGYSRVVSPLLNGDYWTNYQRDGEGEPVDMYPTKGYWVFMLNDGILGGFSSTPIVEVVNGGP